MFRPSAIYLASGDKKYWQKIALDIPPKILIPPLLNMLTSEDNSFNESFIKSRKELIFWTLSSINVKGLISKDFLVDEYLKNKFSVGFLPNLVRHLADSDYELSRKLIDDFRDKERVKTIAGSFGYELGRLFSKNDEFIFELIFDTKLPAEFRTGVIDSYSPIEPEKAIVQFIDLIKDPDEQIAIAAQTKMVYLKDLVKGIIKISADISEEELLADLHKGLPITKHQRKADKKYKQTDKGKQAVKRHTRFCLKPRIFRSRAFFLNIIQPNGKNHEQRGRFFDY